VHNKIACGKRCNNLNLNWKNCSKKKGGDLFLYFNSPIKLYLFSVLNKTFFLLFDSIAISLNYKKLEAIIKI
jgi:hypothetical protein